MYKGKHENQRCSGARGGKGGKINPHKLATVVNLTIRVIPKFSNLFLFNTLNSFKIKFTKKKKRENTLTIQKKKKNLSFLFRIISVNWSIKIANNYLIINVVICNSTKFVRPTSSFFFFFK